MVFSRFKVDLEVGSSTDVGKVRSNNEDSVYTNLYKNLFVVADGVGGHQGGGYASTTATEIISFGFKPSEKKSRKSGRVRETIDSLVNSVIKAHKRIRRLNIASRKASETGNRFGFQDEFTAEVTSVKDMGTTATAAAVKDDNLCIAHVGDSRAYLIRGGEIKQLTEDHDQQTQMLKSAKTKDDQKAVLEVANPNVLERVVGMSDNETIKVDRVVEKLKNDDYCLLCSDGLTKMVEDGEILKVIEGSESTQDACDGLVDLANLNGGADNISATLIKVNKSYRKSWLAAATGAVAAVSAGVLVGAQLLFGGYFSDGQVQKVDESKVVQAAVIAPVEKPDIADDLKVSKIIGSGKDIAVFSGREGDKESVEEKCRMAAYEKTVDLANRTAHRSANSEFNLEEGLSYQNIVNTFSNRRGGEYNRADALSRSITGKSIRSYVQGGRETGFTPASINPSRVNPRVVPECRGMHPLEKVAKTPIKKNKFKKSKRVKRAKPKRVKRASVSVAKKCDSRDLNISIDNAIAFCYSMVQNNSFIGEIRLAKERKLDEIRREYVGCEKIGIKVAQVNSIIENSFLKGYKPKPAKKPVDVCKTLDARLLRTNKNRKEMIAKGDHPGILESDVDMAHDYLEKCLEKGKKLDISRAANYMALSEYRLERIRAKYIGEIQLGEKDTNSVYEKAVKDMEKIRRRFWRKAKKIEDVRERNKFLWDNYNSIKKEKESLKELIKQSKAEEKLGVRLTEKTEKKVKRDNCAPGNFERRLEQIERNRKDLIKDGDVPIGLRLDMELVYGELAKCEGKEEKVNKEWDNSHKDLSEYVCYGRHAKKEVGKVWSRFRKKIKRGGKANLAFKDLTKELGNLERKCRAYSGRIKDEKTRNKDMWRNHRWMKKIKTKAERIQNKYKKAEQKKSRFTELKQDSPLETYVNNEIERVKSDYRKRTLNDDKANEVYKEAKAGLGRIKEECKFYARNIKDEKARADFVEKYTKRMKYEEEIALAEIRKKKVIIDPTYIEGEGIEEFMVIKDGDIVENLNETELPSVMIDPGYKALMEPKVIIDTEYKKEIRKAEQSLAA